MKAYDPNSAISSSNMNQISFRVNKTSHKWIQSNLHYVNKIP